MGGDLSVLSSQASSDLPVTDPNKCTHKFCEKWGPGHYHCADCHATVSDQNLIESEDAIIDTIIDESVAEDGVYRGVSIQFLVDFATSCNCWDMTTRDVRRRFVMPATRASRCRFVELPEMQQSAQKYVGRAGTFVSHTWGAKFGDLVAALCDGDADRSRYVWVDIFAVRQWPSRKPDLDFSAVVRQCGSFVIVCSSLPEISQDDSVSYLTVAVDLPAHVRVQIAFLRVWCLVEIYTAIVSGAAIVMKGGRVTSYLDGNIAYETDYDMLANLSLLVDIESADATVPSDKERILGEIRASAGGVDAVNRAVRGALTGSLVADPLVQCAACDDRTALDEILKNPSKYLFSAAGCGYVKLLQKLIDRGADVDFEVNESTPLSSAVTGGHLECVSLLLKCGCTMNDKANLVVRASMMGHTSVVSLLLDNECDVNCIDEDEQTPLLVAAMQGHTACIKLLMDRGADPFLSPGGLTAVDLVAASGRSKALQMLIDCGVDPALEEFAAAVPFAGSSGSVECLEILIRCGCNLEARDDGLTALLYAAQEGHTACLQYLINAGSDLDAVNDDGMTALDLAEANDHTDCVELLKQHLNQV